MNWQEERGQLSEFSDHDIIAEYHERNFDPVLSAKIDYALYKVEQSTGVKKKLWRLWFLYLESRIP